jgi:hypothetical protein
MTAVDADTARAPLAAAQGGAVPVRTFTPSDLRFTFDETVEGFRHQYDRDFQLFVVWHKARKHDDAILDIIREDFDVLGEFEITWSDERIIRNFERLYGDPLWGVSTKHEDVGTGTFLLVIAEDPAPVYRYRRNVSGFVELTNVHAASAKKAARALAGGYTVHSSNNIREFFRDAALLIGTERLQEVLHPDTPRDGVVREEIRSDLVGDDGWTSLDELWAVLRLACEYVVLRNFEDIPGIIASDPEIDVLAREQRDFAAVVGARPRHGEVAGAAFATTVDGREVIFDIRWVGDGYMDALWQNDVLKRRAWLDEKIAIPRIDDHFFSLLYHAKLQKAQVKPAYVPRLQGLARQLDLPEDLVAHVTDDDAAVRLLDGFLSGHGYSVPRAVDRAVYRNDALIARLTRTAIQPTPYAAAKRELYVSTRFSRTGERAANSRLLRGGYHLLRRIRNLLRPKRS